MDLLKSIRQEKDMYQLLIDYIEDDSSAEVELPDLLKSSFSEIIKKGKFEFTDLLKSISKIEKNHHRSKEFNEKIEKILLRLQNDIKHTFSNSDIFEIFKNNKRILFFLSKKQIITIDEYISQYIMTKQSEKYPQYFFDQIRPFIHEEERRKIDKEFAEYNVTFFNDYEEKHYNGENDSVICDFIRNDSVEDFISYVNRYNTSLSKTKISTSIFETNSLLMKNEPTLIEYAAFFGSIQIFQYLKYNGVELTPSLWIYAIHSKNPELIHILEENQVIPRNENYCGCFGEAIKCHHNDIANYIQYNLLSFENDEQEIGEYITIISFRYHNYFYFPNFSNNSFVFYCICRYKYYDLVDIYLEMNKKDIESSIISINLF